jgi:hypothetical protein
MTWAASSRREALGRSLEEEEEEEEEPAASPSMKTEIKASDVMCPYLRYGFNLGLVSSIHGFS